MSIPQQKIKLETNSRVSFIGFTGSGKSVRGMWLARKWIACKRHVFISDPDNAWENWGEASWDIQDAADRIDGGEKLVRLYSRDIDEIDALFDMARCAPDSMLVIDESSGLFTSRLENNSEAYQEFLNRGRKFEQTLIQVAQSFTQIPAGARPQTHIFAANMSEGTAFAWVRQRLAGRKPPIVPKYHWLLLAPSGEFSSVGALQLSEVERLKSESVENKHVGTYFATERKRLFAPSGSLPPGSENSSSGSLVRSQGDQGGYANRIRGFFGGSNS